MGIQNYMQEVDKTDTIQIGVWTRSSGAIRIFGTQSVCSNNYEYDRKRHTTRDFKSSNGTGRRKDYVRVPLRGTKRKGQILT